MGLGDTVFRSRIDRLYFINMTVQRYVSRWFQLEIDFSAYFASARRFSELRPDTPRPKFSAAFARAIATAYEFRDERGLRPFRKLSAFLGAAPWSSTRLSETIDIGVMMVRPLDGHEHQTLSYPLRNVAGRGLLELSRELDLALTVDEDELPFFRTLKRAARIPSALLYLACRLSRFPRLRAKMMCPTSISILRSVPGTFEAEHISVFALGQIPSDTRRATLTWTYDHRLGFGHDFGPFLLQLKQTIESEDFWRTELQIDA